MSNLDTMTKSFNVVLNVPNKLDVSNFEKRLQNLYDFFDNELSLRYYLYQYLNRA